MRSTLIILVGLLLSQCSPEKKLANAAVIEIPIKIEVGYGPFYSQLAPVSWKERSAESDLGKTRVSVKGIPEDWSDAVVQQIWFDTHQFIFQNYKQGNLSESVFQKFKQAWKINLDGSKQLSQDPIKCFTHIVMTKDSLGKIKYKLDTNNDLDFSDEEEKNPLPLDWNKLDAFVQKCQVVIGEALVNAKVEEIEIPMLIISDRGNVFSNFPQHAQTEIFGKPIFVSSGFTDASFRQTSSVCMDCSPNVKTENVVELNEYLKFDEAIFQNLGVDFNNQVLRIKKMPEDTILYSTQTGFLAKPIEAQDFLTHRSISLKGYTGKYVFIEFWGTWCGPCVSEIPNLKSAYDKMDKDKIAFLGIAQDNPESLKKFLKEKEIEWDQVLINEENKLADLYGIHSYPTSFLLNEEGMIVAKNLRTESLLDTLNYYINN